MSAHHSPNLPAEVSVSDRLPGDFIGTDLVPNTLPGGRMQLETVETTSEDALDVSVVIPCLNEAESIGICIQKARRVLEDLGIQGEVVVADNGSTDGSREIAGRFGARVVDVPVQGYGAALLGGFAAAKGEFVIMADADDSHDLENISPFIERLREGYDLVIGNRFLGGIRPGAMRALNRYIGNPILTRIGRLFFKSPVGDFHCGLRAFRKEAIQGLNLRMTGMEFASEMVVKATLHGLRIAEVPTTVFPPARTRQPHLRPWRDGWRHLRFLLLYSPRWLFLYPGALLMLLGAALIAWLFPGPRRVGELFLDAHTMLLGSAGVVIGFQSVLFAVFSKVFAVNEGLLPPNPLFSKLFRYVTLELGLLLGCSLVLGGLAGLAYAFFEWSRVSFGSLDVTRTLRFVIPSLTSLMLGSQIVLSSFFLSVLGLKRR